MVAATLPDLEFPAETPGRILDAAERLFMEHGYEATSMRMITAAAEVNLAAVNYHFGSKEGLMQAVFKRRLAWLNAERLRLLDALEAKAAGKPLRPSQILEAFFGTLLAIGEDESRGGMVFLKLLGRTLTEPAEFIRAYFADEYAEVVERYKAALFRAVPDVPKEEIAWRFQFMLGATSYAIGGTDALSVVGGMTIKRGKVLAAAEAELLRRRLMPFLLGGLRAPMPDLASVVAASPRGLVKAAKPSAAAAPATKAARRGATGAAPAPAANPKAGKKAGDRVLFKAVAKAANSATAKAGPVAASAVKKPVKSVVRPAPGPAGTKSRQVRRKTG